MSASVDKINTGVFEIVGIKGAERLVVNDNTTLHPVLVPENIDPYEFRKCVISAYAQWLIEGQITLDGVSRRALLPAETCRVALGAPQTAEALSYRGVNLGTSAGLTEKQDLLLQILGDPFDGLTMQQKLKKAGVTNTQYQAWLKQPIFSEQFRAITDQLHNRSEEAMLQLQRKAGEGDLPSIKFLFEMNGRYNPNQQRTMDAMVIVSRVLESISRHVKDPEILAAVASDMRQLAVEANIQIEGL